MPGPRQAYSAGHSAMPVRTPDVRAAWADVAKGLCIALVVMMHATLGTGEAMQGVGFLHEAVAFATPFRIPAFFLLAGLFASRSMDRPWPTFFDRTIIHFGYFYLLWSAIQISLKVGLTQGLPAALHALAESLVEPFGALWFIYLLPAFFIAARLLRMLPPAIVMIAATLLEMAHVHTGWTVIDEFCSRFVWFFAGLWLAPLIMEWSNLVREEKISSLCFTVGFALLNGCLVLNGQATMPGASLFLGALGALALIAVAALLEKNRLGKMLALFGRHSIVVYLAFFLPMAAMRGLLVHAGIADHLGVGITSLLVWLSALALPLLLHAIALRAGLRFLFERPDWARLSSTPATAWRTARSFRG